MSRARLLSALLVLLHALGCSDGGGGGGERVEPTAGYRERQAAYLARCATEGEGRYAQACRAYLGTGDFDVERIRESLTKIDARLDTSDFDLNGLLRVLAFDRERPSLPDDLRAEIERTALGFKYWLDEPGPDDMVWWSENHQILFAAAEMLAGQLWPDEVFPNSGLTGREHVAKALPRIDRWLDYRSRFGFSEWHSNVYFNEDMPGLLNVIDFAEDEDRRTRAAMVLDLMAFDMATNYYRGRFATTHGRTYPGGLLGGLSDSTREAAWIMLGLGADSAEELGAGNFTACFLATSDHHVVPPVLEHVAADARDGIEHRQRDGIDFEDGPAEGIGYTSDEDVMFWWGMTGYVAPSVIQGSFDMIERYDMWQGNIWKDISFLRPFVQEPPLAERVSTLLAPMSRGVALETVNTYTYRTPHYQLSGAQDLKPASWTAQVHVWQATLDPEAYVFTTYPGGSDGDYAAGDWTGGFTPRSTFHRNVGVIQYRRPRIPVVGGLLDDGLFVDYTHAYVPRSAFDEVIEAGNWVVARKGDGYVAIWSQTEPQWSDEMEDELVADARENVWIVELGDRAASGPFAEFAAAVQAAAISVGDTVRYESPSQGTVEVGWTGPMLVEGAAVDLGPYPRWDNVYARQEFGSRVTTIELDRERLELDFVSGRRTHRP